jgi:hypothetical protein
VYRARVRTRSLPRRLAGPAAVAAALPLLLGACSSASSADGSTTTTRTAGHQGSTSVCTLVGPEQVRAALGKDVDRPGVANSTAATVCTYPATGGDRGNSVIITYRGRVSAVQAAAQQAALARLHGTTTPVTVSSGQAYAYSQGSGRGQVNSLVTIVGQTEVTVTSTVPVTKLEDLSQQIFAAFAAEANRSPGSTAPASTTTTSAPAGS